MVRDRGMAVESPLRNLRSSRFPTEPVCCHNCWRKLLVHCLVVVLPTLEFYHESYLCFSVDPSGS